DEAIRLDIHKLIKQAKPGEITWLSYPAGNRLKGELKVRVGLMEKTAGWVRLDFVHQDGEPVDQDFRIESTPTKVGGVKWYGRSSDGTRYQKLYMSPHHREFGTREDQNLRYRARELADRHLARANNISRKLGWDNFDNIPPKSKPKGMPQRTYDR